MPPKSSPATRPNALEIRSLEGNVHHESVDIAMFETVPPRSQVMDAIGQLVFALDLDKVARQPVKRTRCSLKNFYSHHSESFDRIGDLISAENWLNNMEELLATLGCKNEQKVAYTSYRLTREAKRWWQDKKTMLFVDLGLEIAISWDVFKQEFNRHFFPQVVQEATT
jgi:hypothetical protein